MPFRIFSRTFRKLEKPKVVPFLKYKFYLFVIQYEIHSINTIETLLSIWRGTSIIFSFLFFVEIVTDQSDLKVKNSIHKPRMIPVLFSNNLNVVMKLSQSHSGPESDFLITPGLHA